MKPQTTPTPIATAVAANPSSIEVRPAVEDPRQQVAAQLVRAEEVLARRRREELVEVERGRRVRGEERGTERDGDEERHHERRDGGGRAP